LQADPNELDNLAGRETVADVEKNLHQEVFDTWDPKRLRTEVLQSQRRRLWLSQVLNTGKKTPWDYQPYRDASREFVREVEDAQSMLSTEWGAQKR